MKKRILITGSGGYASVGFSRNFKKDKKNYYLVGTDIDPYKILFSEVDKKYLIPPASHEIYIVALKKIIKENNIDFLHAQSDKEIAVLVKIKDELPVKTFLPPAKTIEIAQNKLTTQYILEKNKIPVPATTQINSNSDILKAFKNLGERIWFRATKGAGGKGSLLISDQEIAKAWIKYWNGFGSFMASEYLPGKNIGWDSIWFNGKLIISHTKERLAYALAGSIPSGISGTAEAIRSVKRKDVDEIGKRTILAIDPQPHGVFSVDMKENKLGKPFVTEINPGRFLTSSLHFFAETGFSLPKIFVQLALNEKVIINMKHPSNTYMIRSLDAHPILFKQNYIDNITAKLKKKPFFELRQWSGNKHEES